MLEEIGSAALTSVTLPFAAVKASAAGTILVVEADQRTQVSAAPS